METEKERLLRMHQELCDAAKELMTKKNADYAAGNDPFFNFRMFDRLGILVRLGDKLMRLRSFLMNGKFEVETESLLDTVKDIINYAVIFYAYRDAVKAEEVDPVTVVKTESVILDTTKRFLDPVKPLKEQITTGRWQDYGR
jgi:hypothetical protein